MAAMRPLLRPRHLAATAAVFLLAGGTVLGVANATERDASDPWSAPFGVPWPHVGDRGRYELVADPDLPTPAMEWPRWFAFEWLPDGEGFDDDASVVRVHRLRLVESYAYHTTDEVLPWIVGELRLAAQPDHQAELRNSTGSLVYPATPSMSNTTWLEFETRSFLPRCGLRNLFQGGLLEPDAAHPDPHPCLGGPRDAGNVTVTFMEGPPGQRTAHTANRHSPGSAPSLEAVWREDIPYPLAFRHPDGFVRYELAGFSRGDTPIASEPATLRPAPTLEWTARPAWGLDEAGSGLPFPLREAWEAAKAQDERLQDLLARSPDAYVGLADPQESWDGPERRLEWYLVATDGRDNVGVRVVRTSFVVGDTEIVAPVQADSLPDWEGGGYPEPDGMPASAPTAASLLRAYAAIRGAVPGGVPAVGFDHRCDANMCGRFRAGAVTDVDRTLLPVQGRDHTGIESFLHFDAAGRPVDLRESQRDSMAPGETPRPVPAAAAVAPAPPVEAAGGFLAATTAAAGSALVAALLYWLWPALKAGPAALFTRVRPERTLEHPQRAAILQLIEAEPGLHRNAIVARIGASRSGTDHHLRKLVAAGLVRAVQSPKYVCYVPARGTDRRQAEAAPLLRSDVARRLVAQVRARPGLSSSEAAQALGVSRATLHYHVDRLRRAGLLRSTPHGNGHRLQLTSDGEVAVAGAAAG